MRILISADMEGATGTVLPADVTPGTPEYERCRPLLQGDVNAAIEGFAAAGATRIVVNDSHCDMANLRLDELAAPAELVIGRHKSLGMMELVDTGFDAIAMIGYHVGAGQRGVLAHTSISHGITDVRIDGRSVGEGGFNALVAAEAGVPVILVTGDDRLCASAADWAPQARTVAVKTAISRHSAVCLPPSITASRIRDAAAAALAELTAPTGMPEQHAVEIDVDHPFLADRAANIPTVEAVGPATVRWISPTAANAMRTYRIVVTVIASGREPEWA